MNEEDIVKAILNGDKQLYAEIVKKYQQIVANLVYKMVGDSLDVEEATQQVFVELYTALPRFRYNSKLSTYIYRITVNVVSKMLHSSRKYLYSNEDHPFDTPSNDHNIEQQMIRDELHTKMHQAIGKLKQEQRTAIVLYTFDELSYQQIADLMQVSLAKVESLIFRAKKNLKSILEKEH